MPTDLPLRDIHLPEPVSWFPPAIGWWLVLLLFVLLLFLLWWTIRRLKKPRLNKRAVAEIESVIGAYSEHQDRTLFIQDLSESLKRIGMSYLPRENAAGQSGVKWIEQLNSLPASQYMDDLQIMMLATAPYQKSPQLDDDEINALIEQLRQWVAALPRLQREGEHV